MIGANRLDTWTLSVRDTAVKLAIVAAALQDCRDLRLSTKMFIQVALTVIFRRNQVQTLALSPAWLMTFAVYSGFLHTNITIVPPIRPKPLPLVFEFIIYQSFYYSMPYW